MRPLCWALAALLGGAAAAGGSCDACRFAVERLAAWDGPREAACDAMEADGAAGLCRDLVAGLGPLLDDALSDGPERGAGVVCAQMTSHCEPPRGTRFSSRVRSTAWSFDDEL